MLSAVSLLTFDWERERIKIESVNEYFEEFETIQELQDKTIVCEKCNKRKLINSKVSGIDYCEAKDHSYESKKMVMWEPYLEKKNMITWRKEEKDGHYAYKGKQKRLSSTITLSNKNFHFSLRHVPRYHCGGFSLCTN